MKKIQSAVLIAAYPIFVYLLLLNQLAWLGTLLVLSMIAWRTQQIAHWLLWMGLATLSTLVVMWSIGPITLLKLSPLLIHTSLFILFAQSLNKVPLIERFAHLDFGDVLPPGIAPYCRKLTVIWTGFFAANIVFCAFLAIQNDDDAWILYNGLLIYLLIGTLVLGEYWWRRFAFPKLEIPPLAHTVRNLVCNGHKIFRQGRNDRVG